jgi:hypothetical protein
MTQPDENYGQAPEAGEGSAECPEGTWYFRNHDDGEVYAAHPDGTAHIV